MLISTSISVRPRSSDSHLLSCRFYRSAQWYFFQTSAFGKWCNVAGLAAPHCLLALVRLLAVVLADARPPALLAAASLAVVLAYARPAALLSLAFAVVRLLAPN